MLIKFAVKFVLCYITCISCTVDVFTPIVYTSEGKLRGLRSLSGQNRYYGITYAVSKRFQPPQEPPRWEGVYYAVKRFGSCAQTVAYLKLGTEECLELDVYTPEQEPQVKIPVLVFIHGGAYYYGSKWHYDPEFIVKKNVIVVNINYRLGVLGFLCLNGVANLGLKDQVAALKWIKRNIAAFGGDPDNVTISGQSAGASAAAMHLLSKTSKGLFHKAILLSGTPITPWAYNLEPEKSAFEDAAKLGGVHHEQDVYNIFSKATLYDLLNQCRDTSINPRYFKYSPCVDSNYTDPFFHDTPYNTIVSGNFNKVPIISGFADVEGMLFYGLNNENTLRDIDENLIEKLPSVFSWCSGSDKKDIESKLRSYYFKRKRITKSSVKGVVAFYSDWIAYSTADAFSNIMVKYSDKPVYNYMFSYEGDRNYAKFLFGSETKMKGASHSDDIFYIFKPGGLSLVLSKPDEILIDRLATMLTNFMKYGDPTPRVTQLVPLRWAATSTNRSLTMKLDRRLSVIETPASHKGQFFLNLLCKYGQKGYVPCDTN